MTNKLGLVIKRIREERGLKQIYVAKKAQISNRYLSAIESGKRTPTLETIEKIAKAVGISTPGLFLEFIGDSAEVENHKKDDLKSIIKLLQDIFEPN